MSLTLSKQHNYDFNSVEEIIRSAQQAGLDRKEIASRLDLSYSDFLKWYVAFSSYTRIFSDRVGEPPELEVSQERLDYLAEYCRTQGIFPIINHQVNDSQQSVLPHYVPAKNKAAQKICLYANRYISERDAEPTELDLWDFMWTHRNDCGFEMRPAPNGKEVYYLQDTPINLRGFKRRLEEYRRT